MFEIFQVVFTPMLVLFSCLVIGFTLNRTHRLPAYAASVLSTLETYVLVPALTLNTFIKYCTVDSLRAQYVSVLYCAAAILIGILLSYPVSRLLVGNAPQRDVYKYALSFGNFGFAGNMIVLAIFGDRFLYDYMLFCLPLNVAGFTWGLSVLIPKDKQQKNPLKNLINPMFFSLALGIVLGLTGAQTYLPSFVMTTIGNLGACMSPIAMVLTGFVIGDCDLLQVLRNKTIYITSFLRLLVIPACFVLAAFLLGVDSSIAVMCLFAFATPVGINTVVFPAAYGGDTTPGASLAVISSVFSVFTLPAMYTLLNLLFA